GRRARRGAVEGKVLLGDDHARQDRDDRGDDRARRSGARCKAAAREHALILIATLTEAVDAVRRRAPTTQWGACGRTPRTTIGARASKRRPAASSNVNVTSTVSPVAAVRVTRWSFSTLPFRAKRSVWPGAMRHVAPGGREGAGGATSST